MSQERNNKFELLQVGRAVAALLVVLLHAQNIMGEPRFYGVKPLGTYANNLNVGVDFFFVLSGFIIAWVHWGDIGEAGRLPGYARKRFLRIFPPYWGILFPLIAMYLLVPSAGSEDKRDLLNIVLSIFLIPHVYQPILGVAWTLTHEIFFYILFGIIIRFGRQALWFFPAWAAAIVILGMVADLQYPLAFLFNPFNLEFIMGVGAAFVLRHRTIPKPWLLLAVSSIAFTLCLLFLPDIQDNALRGRLVFGILGTGFVLASIEIERYRALPLPRFVLVLGAASYSIYLVHPVALSFVMNALARLKLLALPMPVVLAVLFLIAVAIGTFYALVIEKRLMDMTRSLLFSFKSEGRNNAAPVKDGH